MSDGHHLAASGHAPIELDSRVPVLSRWLQRPVSHRRDDRIVGAHLDRTIGLIGAVLHDVRVPGTDRVVDHVAVAPSGIWLIDTVVVEGRVERVAHRGAATQLVIDDADRGDLIDIDGALGAAAEWLATIRLSDAPVHRALCLVDAHWPLTARPFAVDGVLVAWPRALTDKIASSGMLHVARARDIATMLSAPATTIH